MTHEFPPPLLDRPLEEMAVGATAAFTLTVDERSMAQFRAVSGDGNPLHTDAAFAGASGHPSTVVYGQLTAAPISALAGHLLPGRRCLLLEVRSRFVKPVYPGDRLTYLGTVTHVSTAARLIKVQVDVTNQQGTTVLRGSYDAQVLEMNNQTQESEAGAR